MENIPKKTNPYGYFLIQDKETKIVRSLSPSLDEMQELFPSAQYNYVPWVPLFDGGRVQPHVYPPECGVPIDQQTPWEDARTLEEIRESAFKLIADVYRERYEGQKRDGDEAKTAAALAAWDAKRQEVKDLYPG